MTVGSDSFALATPITLESYADFTPSAALTVEAWEANHATDWEYRRTAWWKFVVPDDIEPYSEIRIRDLSTANTGVQVGIWTGTNTSDLTQSDWGSDGFDVSQIVTPGETYWIQYRQQATDPDDTVSYSFFIGLVTYSYGEWVQGDSFDVAAEPTYMFNGVTRTGFVIEGIYQTTDRDFAINEELDRVIAAAVANGQVVNNGTVANYYDFTASLYARADLENGTTSPMRTIGQFDEKSATFEYLPAVQTASSAYAPPLPTEPLAKGQEYTGNQELEGPFEVLDAEVEVFVWCGGADGNSPLVVDSFLKIVPGRYDPVGERGSLIESFTYTAPVTRSITFNTGPVPIGGAFRLNMEINVAASLPWQGGAPVQIGNEASRSTAANAVYLERTEADPYFRLPMVGAHVKPSRHRFQIRHYQTVERPPPPAVSTGLPLLGWWDGERTQPIAGFPDTVTP